MKKFYLVILSLMMFQHSGIAAPLSGSTKAIQKNAEIIFDGIMSGLYKSDYLKYSENFDRNLKEALPEAKFLQTRQTILSTLGECKKKIFLGILNQNNQSVIYWKGQFSLATDDVLIKLVLSTIDGKTFVTGLWFQ